MKAAYIMPTVFAICFEEGEEEKRLAEELAHYLFMCWAEAQKETWED